MKNFSLASDTNLAGEIRAKILISKDLITPCFPGYLAIVIKTLSFYKKLSHHVRISGILSIITTLLYA